MFDQSVPVALRAIDRAQVLLDLAPPPMLSARLHPEMFDCAEQFRIVASFALRTTFPLTDRPCPTLPEGPPHAQLAAARAAILTLTEADFAQASERMIHHRAGFADLAQPAQDYLQQFAIPNLWFHLAMAFAILRHQGAALGKADFDGLHGYPAGFSWETGQG